jgi:hypothetical protein
MKLVIAALVLFAIFVIAGMDFDFWPDEHYCKKVALYKASNGRWGWPPYRGEEYCPPTK